MKHPNKYSHAFVLSNYSSNGLIDPASPTQELPPFPIPARSSYKPIARPARFTLGSLSNLTEGASLPEARDDKVSDGDGVGRTAERMGEAKMMRSNSVVTQIFAPDGGAIPHSLESTNSVATEAPSEDQTSVLAPKQLAVSGKRGSHQHDESITTQIYAPIEPSRFSPLKMPPQRTANTSRRDLKSNVLPQGTAGMKGLSSQYQYEVPRSWISFGKRGSRYWKPLPQEPLAVPYRLPGPGIPDANTKELEPEPGRSKRNSNESASTTSTSSTLSRHHGTPNTSPSTTSPSLASPVEIRKPTVPASPQRSRIPLLASRRSGALEDQTKMVVHRRISSQLSEDFRAIDNYTIESLMRSPPRDPGNERDLARSTTNEYSIGKGKAGPGEDDGDLWLYPPTGPEIFCTPPKVIPLPSSRPSAPTSKRSSFSRHHRPQASRLPSQASFSGFSDTFPTNGEAASADVNTSDSEDAAVPPPIALGRREERPARLSSDKRGPSFRDFMSGRDRSNTMSSGRTERPSTSGGGESGGSGGKRSKPSSFTAFMSSMSRRSSTSESVTAAKQVGEMKRRVEVKIPSEERNEQEPKEKHMTVESPSATKYEQQPPPIKPTPLRRDITTIGTNFTKDQPPPPQIKSAIPQRATTSTGIPHNKERRQSTHTKSTPPQRGTTTAITTTLPENQNPSPRLRLPKTPFEKTKNKHRESWGCGDKPLVTVLDFTAENIATSPPIPQRWQINAETTKPIIPPVDDSDDGGDKARKTNPYFKPESKKDKVEEKVDKVDTVEEPQPSSLPPPASSSGKGIKSWRINRFRQNLEKRMGMNLG